MKNIAVVLLMFVGFGMVGQTQFEVPKNYKFKTKEDYPKYEQDIIKATDWLINQPSNENRGKRKEVSKFVLGWVMGSPSVSIVISDLADFSSSPDYLIIFMGAWSSENIKNRNYDDQLAGNLAGIEAVIQYYEKNQKRLGKDKRIKKYIKLKKREKLKEFVQSKIPKED